MSCWTSQSITLHSPCFVLLLHGDGQNKKNSSHYLKTRLQCWKIVWERQIKLKQLEIKFWTHDLHKASYPSFDYEGLSNPFWHFLGYEISTQQVMKDKINYLVYLEHLSEWPLRRPWKTKQKNIKIHKTLWTRFCTWKSTIFKTTSKTFTQYITQLLIGSVRREKKTLKN